LQKNFDPHFQDGTSECAVKQVTYARRVGQDPKLQTSQGYMMGHKTAKQFLIVLKGGETRGGGGDHIPESYDLPAQLKLKHRVRSVFDIFFWEIVSFPFCG
jgi:hypothetical protein